MNSEFVKSKLEDVSLDTDRLLLTEKMEVTHFAQYDGDSRNRWIEGFRESSLNNYIEGYK